MKKERNARYKYSQLVMCFYTMSISVPIIANQASDFHEIDNLSNLQVNLSKTINPRPEGPLDFPPPDGGGGVENPLL